MNQQELLYRISQLFSRFTEQVKILNSNGDFSINVHAENILIKILNVIFDCELKNVNYEEKKNYPSIDLRDQTKRIAIQVTSSPHLEKIKQTLSGFIDNELYKDYDTLYIYIITEKQKTYKQSVLNDIIGSKFSFSAESIIDKTDLFIKLNKMNDIQKIKTVCQLLEKQFADNRGEYDKWNSYCKGLYEYDQYVTKLYTYFDVKGFSPRVNNTVVRLNIDKIYVPLTFKVDVSNNADEVSSKGGKFSCDIVTALENYERLVILGDPGSGKSTSLKYLAYSVCSQRAGSNELKSFIPVLIKATEYERYLSDTGRTLSEYIIDSNTKYGLLFSEGLENNELIVLFDGLDEINVTNKRHAVVDKINSFIAQYPKIKIVVSSRIVGYKETRLSFGFSHFEVEKFSDDQIFLFINNWYSSIAFYSDKNQDYASQEAENLYRSIKQNSSVYRLACNPLLMTIIALIYFQGCKLPEKRAQLYDISTSTLLDNWVQLRANQNNNIDRETLIELLAIIAFHIHENYASGLIPENELRAIIKKEYFKIYPYLSPKELKQDINDIVSFLREDAGFLFEKGYDENGLPLFGFVHLTFQEYYAAIEFKTKWKEGSIIANLKDYIYNYSWTEVIKLAASLFKLNEPGRFGRSSVTKFVSEILNVEELLPGTARPIQLVCQILNEDVEIEFDMLKTVVNNLFKLLSSIDSPKTGYHTGYISERCFAMLLTTTIYRKYILDRIDERLKSNTSPLLSERLISILMNSSDNQDVYDYLLSILHGNHVEMKEYMYEYRTVLPVAYIVKTSEFRSEIVKYVNSSEFSKKYKGHLPTQYCCCFNDDIENMLLSIKLISDDKIKKDLINFYVFSWGLGNVDNLKAYYEVVKKNYPDFNLKRIENQLVKLENYNSRGLEKYPILEINNTEIYRIITNTTSYAIMHKEEITILDSSFRPADFKPFLGNKSSSFAYFCNMVVAADKTDSKEILIHNNEELKLLMEYGHTIHWFANLKQNSAKIYALSHLFAKDEIDKEIIFWLKKEFFRNYGYIKLEKPFKMDDFEESVKSSSLDVFDKIVLLKLVNPQFRDKEMLSLAIEEYKKIESEQQKEECRNVIISLF